MENEFEQLSGSPATIKRKQAFLEAAFQHRGNITKSAAAAGISRRTYYQWCEDDQEFKEAFEDVKESYLDHVVDQLNVLIDGIPIKDDKGNIVDWKRWPDVQAILSTLRSIGKHRGYSERHEVGLEAPIQFVHDSEAVDRLIEDSKRL